MNTSQSCEVSQPMTLSERAKNALERVCSGRGLDPSTRYYGHEFIDHVNDLEFAGIQGTQESVQLYTQVMTDIIVEVKEQVVEGDRVASRFVVNGSCFGRKVTFNGITISRFAEGKIVEDWSVTDTLSMLRQAGIWRSAFIAIKQWRVLNAARKQ